MNFCGLYNISETFTTRPEWFDNGFEIESKYHRKTVVLLLIAHILSLQDVVHWSVFFSYNISELVNLRHDHIIHKNREKLFAIDVAMFVQSFMRFSLLISVAKYLTGYKCQAKYQIVDRESLGNYCGSTRMSSVLNDVAQKF